MQRLVALLVGLVLLVRGRAAHAERELIVPFEEKGHVVLDQLAGLRLDTNGLGYAAPIGIAVRTTSDSSLTSVWFAPAADVFVTDHLSVGGRVDISHAWGSATTNGQRLELPGTTSLTFLPRVGFYFAFSARFGFWMRAGVGWTSVQSSSFDASGSVPVTATFRSMLLDVDATLTYRFTETFFLKAGPEVGVTFGGQNEVSSNGQSAGSSSSLLQIGGAVGFGMNIEL